MSFNPQAVAALISCFLLTACATPLPDHRCSEGAEIEAPDHYETRRTIDLACERFAKRADTPITETGLGGVEITVRDWRESTACESGARGCVRLRPGPIKIDVGRKDWRAILAHEVYHVLLWQTRPDIRPEDHHRWLFEHRLCWPLRLCGYPDRTPP